MLMSITLWDCSLRIFLNVFELIVFIRHLRFCNTQQCFLRYGLIRVILCNNEADSMWQVLDKKVLTAFQKRTIVLHTCENYLTLLKSPEFMSLSVSKHAYSAPALTLPSWVPSFSAASRKPLHRTKLLFYTPPPTHTCTHTHTHTHTDTHTF